MTTTIDPEAHLHDRDLYHQYYQGEAQPGHFTAMRADEPRLAWTWRHVQPTDDVIDIGCHKGEMTLYLRQRTRGRVVGVDISEQAIADARHFFGTENIEWVLSEAEAIPLPSDSFDVAVLCEILEHVIDPEPVLREAERLVKPGGRIILSVPQDAVEMGHGEIDEREKVTGLRLNAHVREFVPAEVLAGKPGLQLGAGMVASVGFKWRFAVYTVSK
jgi:2-polyprenyl-3-methyl-5-hydroxy-6-metoxy-1,4-benzoquinol methylase